MRTFAQKRKAIQQPTPSESAKLARARFGQNRGVTAILHQQRPARPPLQRTCAACEEEEQVQPKRESGKEPQPSDDIDQRIAALRGLIAFGAAGYENGSSSGRRLLAHELTHTIQQGHSPLRVMREPDPASVDQVLEAFEQELQSVAKAGGIYVIRGETQTDGRPVGYVGMSTDLAVRLGSPTHFKPRAIVSQCEPSTIQAEFYILSKQKMDVTLRHRPYTDRDVLRWIEQSLLDQTADCVELLNARREMNEEQFNDMTANIGSAWTEFLEGRTQWTYADRPFREDCPVTSKPGLIPAVNPADWIPENVKDWWEETKENKEWLEQQWWWPG